MYRGVPGQWSWELAYRYPLALRWTLHTWAEDQAYVYEGEGHARLTLGGAEIPAPAAVERSLRSQARWVAVTNLDLLRDPKRAQWWEIPGDSLPPGVGSGLVARLSGGRSTYRLLFDAAGRLVAAEGEVDLHPIGSGLLRATFEEFRPVAGYVLPFRAHYELEGEPLLEEDVVSYRIGPSPPPEGATGGSVASVGAQGSVQSAVRRGRGLRLEGETAAKAGAAGGEEPGQSSQSGPRTSGSSGPPSRR